MKLTDLMEQINKDIEGIENPRLLAVEVLKIAKTREDAIAIDDIRSTLLPLYQAIRRVKQAQSRQGEL